MDFQSKFLPFKRKFTVWESRKFGIFLTTVFSYPRNYQLDLRNFGFFWQTFSHHWKFRISESRNFGFFSLNSFLSSNKLSMDLRNFGIFYANFHHWKFSTSKSRNFGFFSVSIFSLIQENIHRIWGILDFFLQTLSHHWKFTV